MSSLRFLKFITGKQGRLRSTLVHLRPLLIDTPSTETRSKRSSSTAERTNSLGRFLHRNSQRSLARLLAQETLSRPVTARHEQRVDGLIARLLSSAREGNYRTSPRATYEGCLSLDPDTRCLRLTFPKQSSEWWRGLPTYAGSSIGTLLIPCSIYIGGTQVTSIEFQLTMSRPICDPVQRSSCMGETMGSDQSSRSSLRDLGVYISRSRR